MTPQELSGHYERYKEESARMAAEGRAIGTFTAWLYEKKLVKIRIAKTWEEHKRGRTIYD